MKKYIMAILIWIMIIPIAILNGGFREYILVKLGILARPLSGIILSVCIFSCTENKKMCQKGLYHFWCDMVYINQFI